MLDKAVRQAYELLHASRLHPGVHWCVGIFKTGHGTDTVITSNDGASYIPPGVFIPSGARVLYADTLLDNAFQTKWFGWVNPSEIMVAYAAHGLANEEIAQRLFLSPLTVKTHRNRAMSKLGVRDRAQLVVLAYQTGLVRPGDTPDR